uniref:Uncharacterized protein n=1 Tax=Lactuca sativa TaxID=4236 RepID=A0A9R1VHI8_LACSA|nr:hypothetical protein LSAT_V11C500247690 [Lactuca sativa]
MEFPFTNESYFVPVVNIVFKSLNLTIKIIFYTRLSSQIKYDSQIIKRNMSRKDKPNPCDMLDRCSIKRKRNSNKIIYRFITKIIFEFVYRILDYKGKEFFELHNHQPKSIEHRSYMEKARRISIF